MWGVAGLTLVIALMWSHTAFAYVGPGAGAGVLSVILGILAALALAIVAVVWYPVKRLRGRRKRAEARRQADAPVHPTEKPVP
jgi:type VI protein secretion system component VasK